MKPTTSFIRCVSMFSHFFTCLILWNYYCSNATTIEEKCHQFEYFKLDTASVGSINNPSIFELAQLGQYNCFQWYFEAKSDEIIVFSFTFFNLEESVDCKETSLVIGPVVDNPEYKKCGSTLPQPFISEREHAYVKLYISSLLDTSYFALTYYRVRTDGKCEPQEFTCFNRHCIYYGWVCNGMDECGDYSDEIFCQGLTEGYAWPSTEPPQSSSSLSTTPLLCRSTEVDCISNRTGGRICAPRCDGLGQCQDWADEAGCPAGHIHSSYGYIYLSRAYLPAGDSCHWTLHSSIDVPVYLRVREMWTEYRGQGYLAVFDGQSDQSTLLANYSLDNPPPSNQVLVSTFNWMYIQFQSIPGSPYGFSFNLTYHWQGTCLETETKCKDNLHCYGKSDLCDGHFMCNTLEDEKGCGNCPAESYPCASQLSKGGSFCFTEEQYCNGEETCADMTDEMNCNPQNCNSAQGEFLCANNKCIYEDWLCDGENDCQDNSDEINCSYVLSTQVVIAAVVGSVLCGLLLVIALGCTCKLYALRMAEHRARSAPHLVPGSHTAGPLRQMEAEMMRRPPPPSYAVSITGEGAAAGESPPSSLDPAQLAYLESLHSGPPRRGRRHRRGLFLQRLLSNLSDVTVRQSVTNTGQIQILIGGGGGNGEAGEEAGGAPPHHPSAGDAPPDGQVAPGQDVAEDGPGDDSGRRNSLGGGETDTDEETNREAAEELQVEELGGHLKDNCAPGGSAGSEAATTSTSTSSSSSSSAFSDDASSCGGASVDEGRKEETAAGSVSVVDGGNLSISESSSEQASLVDYGDDAPPTDSDIAPLVEHMEDESSC